MAAAAFLFPLGQSALVVWFMQVIKKRVRLAFIGHLGGL